MEITERILDYQIKRGFFDNEKFEGTKGIAKLAVTQGFDKLSEKQKAVLKPYLSQTCSGITDPGGHHNGCSAKLTDEELLDAYHRCDDPEVLVCENCNSEDGYYSHQWDRISKE